MLLFFCLVPIYVLCILYVYSVPLFGVIRMNFDRHCNIILPICAPTEQF